MKIYTKIITGYVIISILLSIIALGGYTTLKNISKTFEELESDIVPCAIAMTDMESSINKIHLCVMEYILEGDYSTKKNMQTTMQHLETAARQYTDHETYIGIEEQKSAKELETKIKTVNTIATELITLKDNGMTTEELLKKEEELGLHRTIHTLLKQLREHKTTHIEELTSVKADTSKSIATANTIAPIFILAILFLSLTIGTLTAKRISEPLLKLKTGTESIGKGNLDYRIDIKSKDEIGDLAKATNSMAEDLKEYQNRLIESEKIRADELENQVSKKTKELRNKMNELEKFNRFAVGREHTIIDMKKEINTLCKKLGEEPRYNIKQKNKGDEKK